MNELDGQVLLVVLILGKDGVELDDWAAGALHEEPLPEGDRLPDRQSARWLLN